MTLYEHLGYKLVWNKKIHDSKLSQAQLAEKMGCTVQNIKSVLYKKIPTVRTLEKFAEILNCDVSDFFEKDESAKPEKIISTFVSSETGKRYKIVEINDGDVEKNTENNK